MSPFQKFITILLSVMLLPFLNCQKSDQTMTTVEKFKPDSSGADEQKSLSASQSYSEVSADSLLKLMQAKEEELQAIAARLKQQSVDLAAREKQLQILESDLKAFRQVSYFILITGLVLIMMGFIFIVRRAKNKSSRIFATKVRSHKEI